MYHLSLFRTDILVVLINLVEFIWCSAGLDPTPSWLYLVKCRYDFIDIIYHAGLDSAALSIVKFHPKLVVNLASVGGHLS